MINLSGQWPAPHAEDQFSHVVPKDTDACVSYSTVHVIESFIKYTLGLDLQFSERFLAKMSGTTLDGNYIGKVYNALKQYGLVLDSDWPEPLTFTWEEYYAPIPPEIIAKGQDLFKYIEIGELKNIPIDQESVARTETPLIIFTPAGTPTHARANLGGVKPIFDSYPPYLEPMPTSIYAFYQIQLKAKGNIMFKKCVKADGKTFGVLIQTPNGDQIIYATDEAQWTSWSKSDSYGLSTVNPDGTPNFSLDGVVQLPY